MLLGELSCTRTGLVQCIIFSGLLVDNRSLAPNKQVHVCIYFKRYFTFRVTINWSCVQRIYTLAVSKANKNLLRRHISPFEFIIMVIETER